MILLKVRCFVAIVVILTTVLTLLPIASVRAKQPNWWFDYSDMSIRWRADKLGVNDWSFLVDLDGDHSTFAGASPPTSVHVDYGYFSDLEACKNYSNMYLYGSAALIGTLKIDQNPTPPKWDWHIHETYGGFFTEWFCFSTAKKSPPSNWIVILYASDGTHRLPITSTFWYSENGGVTWNSFTP